MSETKNIHQKLVEMQCDLLHIPIEKSGKNPFGNFNYYELDDLLPPILLLCKEYSCSIYFNFPCKEGICEKGTLNLINNEKPTDKIVVEVPFAEIEKLPKMNFAQTSGTYQTYMKRYLLLNLFAIVEDEIIDATLPSGKNETVGEESSKDDSVKPKLSVKKAEKKPKVLKKVMAKCNELYPERECDKKLLNGVSMKMFKEKEISKTEREEIYDYLFSSK